MVTFLKNLDVPIKCPRDMGHEIISPSVQTMAMSDPSSSLILQ